MSKQTMSMFARFRRRFWRPPRAHGDIIEDRSVSFLELFYDLVFVVVIARAFHTLADDVSWRGLGEYVVIFGLIWIAWLNGTLYHELHGRDDGRSRSFLFVQMTILSVLAVFTGDAAQAGGTGFAITYALLLLVLSWLWALVALGWVIGGVALSATAGESVSLGLGVTDSMVERFGLFTIIVLGEVVVGVVDGLEEVERTARTIVTGVLALMVGFGFWWTYFDFVGGRLPRRERAVVAARWMYSHLPVTIAVAASGAAMVGLVEHAADDHTPETTAWLLAGSVAVFLVVLTLTMASLEESERFAELYRPLSAVMCVGAAAALAIGRWAPVPWLLAASLALVLTVIWFFAVDRSLRLGRQDGETACRSDPTSRCHCALLWPLVAP